jgi:protein-S-isoprenylcysteine O-methyltransferase Ste14
VPGAASKLDHTAGVRLIFVKSQSVPMRRLAEHADQIIAVALYIWLCQRLVPQTFTPDQFYTLLLMVVEGIALFFLLIRRSTDKISLNPRDWIVAYACTLMPLLVLKGEIAFLPRVGICIIMAGFVLHLGAKLNIRRSFGIVPADRGLKTLGLYAFVRHPMYLGYMVTHVGFLLAAPSVWNAAVYAVAWTLLVVRIFFEERFLSLNPDYRAYCAKVRYRLIPAVF